MWRVEIPAEGHDTQHQEITQNFVDAILDGAPLIAPAEEGLHSVELANAMIYSSARDATVEMPLDSQAYEQHLCRLIAESTFRKRTGDGGTVDIIRSFSRP